MSWTSAAKFIAYATCVFLMPFCIAAYVAPMSWLSLSSIGLEPADAATLTGLSNIRGSIGGLRMAIIVMAAWGTWAGRRDLCLGAAILVAAISGGRFLSLVVDGWEFVSFFTASAEVVIASALLHLGGLLGARAPQGHPGGPGLDEAQAARGA